MTSATAWANTTLHKGQLPIILIRPNGLVMIPIDLTGPMQTAAMGSARFRGYVAACAVWQFGRQVDQLWSDR